MGSNRILYIEGQVIGSCVFLYELPTTYKYGQSYRMGKFKCKCGNEFDNPINNVKKGNTTSCGCVYNESLKNRNKTHGLTYSQEYITWCGMRSRCNSKNSLSYKNYGARGIKVCDRWLKSFENFYADMGQKPTSSHSLDRIDNNGDYCPENCKWVTKSEQANNTRNNVHYTLNEETKTISQWAEKYNIPYRRLRERLRNGWLIGDAVITPFRQLNRYNSIYCQPCIFYPKIVPKIFNNYN